MSFGIENGFKSKSHLLVNYRVQAKVEYIHATSPTCIYDIRLLLPYSIVRARD